MFRPYRYIAGFLFLLAGAGPAASQAPTDAQKNAIRSACRSDYQAHCANVAPGGQASFACLQQNYSSLSAPCQNAVGAIAGGPPSAPSSPGSASTSTQQPQASTHAPPPHPANPRAEAAIVARACRFDYREFCRGIRPGGGEVLQCLKANGPSLSPPCREALMSLRAH
jgi:hypothetical protein